VTIGTVNSLGTQAKADVNAEVDAALQDIDLDHLAKTSYGASKPADGSLFDQIMNKDGSQTFDPSTDSLEALADSGATGLTQQQVRDAMKLAASAGDPADGSIDKYLKDMMDGSTGDFNTNTDSLHSIRSELDNVSTFDPSSDTVIVGTNNDKTGYSLTSDQSSVTIGTVNSLGNQAKADVNAEVDSALQDIDLDHLVKSDYGASKPADGSLFDQIMNKDGSQTFDSSTDSLEALADSGATGLTQQQVRDAMKLAASAGDPADGSIDKYLKDMMDGSAGDFDKTNDSLHDLRSKLDSISVGLGAGAITFTYTLTSSTSGLPIADADVWVTTDEDGTNVIASGRTNQEGKVTFYLDAGTVYIWRQKSGWNFDNPDVEVVS